MFKLRHFVAILAGGACTAPTMVVCTLVLLFLFIVGDGSLAGENDLLTLRGSEIYLDGKPFVPRGLHMTTVQTPVGHRNKINDAVYQRFSRGSSEIFEKARQWDANLISIPVSQPGLDHEQSDICSQEYIQQVDDVVRTVRKAGFVVLLTVNDQTPSADPVNHKLPGKATLRAWTTLTSHFNNDPGIIYEMFNEPQPFHSPKAWEQWAHGGFDQEGGPSVGMQQLVNHVRKTGARNVIVVDGLNWARSFEGAPEINDPLNRLVYGVHPYYTDNYCDRDAWQKAFGFLVDRGHPVFASEWSAPTGDKNNFCCTRGLSGHDLAQQAWKLLTYLKSKHIGLNAYGFMSLNTIVLDLNGTPTTYDGYSWDQRGGGPGLVIKHFYENLAKEESRR